jgi:hypothetical protein
MPGTTSEPPLLLPTSRSRRSARGDLDVQDPPRTTEPTEIGDTSHVIDLCGLTEPRYPRDQAVEGIQDLDSDFPIRRFAFG